MVTPAARAILVAAVLLAAPRRADAEAPKPLPGSVGLVARDIEVKNACVTTFRQIKKVKRGDDPAMVAALTYPRISGLEFDPAKGSKVVQASMRKFETWLKNLHTEFDAARKVQEQVVFADGTTAQAKVEAVARMAILLDQAVMLIESPAMPASLRKTPEAVDIFCDRMLEVAEPIRAQAKDARAACARTIADHAVPAGWWSDICVAPAP